MTTFYEEFTRHRLEKKFGYEPDLNGIMIGLFIRIFGIDLSNEIKPFSSYGGSFGLETSFSYRFKYGQMDVSTNKENMEVIIYFRDPTELSVPYLAKQCTVKVDHDLNFIESRFHFYTQYSKIRLGIPHFGFSLLRVERVSDRERSYNSISYTADMNSDDYIDLSHHALDKHYFIINHQFETAFREFMTLCSKKPADFYNVFSEYPSYSDFIGDINQLIYFLNLFQQQYTQDLQLLKSRMLLFHMQAI